MHRQGGKTVQQVLIELAPEYFIDPGRHPAVARVGFALVHHHRGMQTLPSGDKPRRQVGRERTGARQGGEIAVGLVACDGALDECVEAVSGSLRRGGPPRTHRSRG